MSYLASIGQFNSTFLQSGKFKHQHCRRFKLFPFVANNNSPIVLDLSRVIGKYLSVIGRKKPVFINCDTLLDQMIAETEISTPQMQKQFRDIIRRLFFDDNNNLHPLNIGMLSHIVPQDTAEERVADYLIDVLGNQYQLRQVVDDAFRRSEKHCHVLERLLNKRLLAEPSTASGEPSYYQIITALQERFEEDFKYVLGNKELSQNYLVKLLEFYYFIYTAHVCLQLECFGNGDRNTCDLYFSLDWETTNQSRKCYEHGWRKLQPAVKHMYAHAVSLEILNQTANNDRVYDYIALQRMATASSEADWAIGEQIGILTNEYRKVITDCPTMTALPKDEHADGVTAAAMRYLFKNVKTQFELTDRKRPYDAYAKQFETFAQQHFLKARGRSGQMLNLTEELLIFLTIICTKDEEHMRLNSVFEEFEARGVYLDLVSKKSVIEYYEKLNLIEKKSDSGDAMYVKRIL